MALKDFDVKTFLLEKGERVGLYAAGGIAALLIALYLFGMQGKGFRSPSAKAKADGIEKTAKEKDQLLANNSPSQEERDRILKVDPRLLKNAANPQQDPDDYRLAGVFEGSGAASTKRRQPTVFGPEEFKSAVVLAQVKANMFLNDPSGVKYGILTSRQRGRGIDAKAAKEFTDRVFGDRQKGRNKRPQLPPNLLGGQGGGMPGMGGMGPGMGGPGMGGPGMGGPGMGGPGLGGGGGRGRPGGLGGGGGGGDADNPGGGGLGMPGMGGGAMGGQELTLQYVTEDELGRSGGELAETLLPYRMAYIVGAFPYKAQVEEFKKALRLQQNGQVLQEAVQEPDDLNNGQLLNLPAFRFLGFDVERREVRPDGTRVEGPSGEWKPLDLKSEDSPYVNMMVYTGKREEVDSDPELAQVLGDGLMMPRPLQIAQGNYPKIEKELEKIKATLDEIKGKNRVVAKFADPRFDRKAFNAFSANRLGAGTGSFGMGGGMGMPGMMGGGGDADMPGGPGGGIGGAGPGGRSGMRGGMGGPGMAGPGMAGPGMMGPGAGAGMRGGMGGPGMAGPGMAGPGMPGGSDAMTPGAGMGGMPGMMGSSFGAEWVPPEYCVMRFLDVTLEPGKVYEYRLKVRMANPNYGRKDVAYPKLAEERELTTPDWVEVKDADGTPIRVSAPQEMQYYAVDQRQITQKETNYRGQNASFNPRPDQAVIQVHKWMDLYWYGNDRRNSSPVGDWTIAERMFITRGEHIGQVVPTKLPVWAPEQRGFQLAAKPGTPPRARTASQVDVSYGAEPNRSPILIDFEGGPQMSYTRLVSRGEGVPPKKEEIKADAPQELLLMSPRGRLFARHGADDEADKVREERHKLWAKKVEEVANNKYQPGQIFNQFGPGMGMPGMGGADQPGGPGS